MVSLKTSPLVQRPTTRRDLTTLELLPGERRVCTTHQTSQFLKPAPEIRAPKEQAPKTSDLENHWSLCPQYPKSYSELKNTPDRLPADSLTPGPRAKAAVWKSGLTILKKIHLIIENNLPEGQGLVRILSRDIFKVQKQNKNQTNRQTKTSIPEYSIPQSYSELKEGQRVFRQVKATGVHDH